MSTTIALAGKGGVGKTTIAGMVIKYLVQTQPGAVLAIDADPSSNLNMVLGLDLDWTVGDIREDRGEPAFGRAVGVYLVVLAHLAEELLEVGRLAGQGDPPILLHPYPLGPGKDLKHGPADNLVPLQAG